eukprot:912480-Rhodomonas_salina.1
MFIKKALSKDGKNTAAYRAATQVPFHPTPEIYISPRKKASSPPTTHTHTHTSPRPLSSVRVPRTLRWMLLCAAMRQHVAFVPCPAFADVPEP